MREVGGSSRGVGSFFSVFLFFLAVVDWLVTHTDRNLGGRKGTNLQDILSTLLDGWRTVLYA